MKKTTLSSPQTEGESTMACRIKDSTINPAVKLIAEEGFEGLQEAITLLINEAMQIERSHHLQAESYERTEALSIFNLYAILKRRRRACCPVGLTCTSGMFGASADVSASSSQSSTETLAGQSKLSWEDTIPVFFLTLLFISLPPSLLIFLTCFSLTVAGTEG